MHKSVSTNVDIQQTKVYCPLLMDADALQHPSVQDMWIVRLHKFYVYE